MVDKHEASKFRRFLPQVSKMQLKSNNNERKITGKIFEIQIIASMVQNLLLVDLGASLVFPSIMIPSLTGIPNEFNRNETLSLTASQASWLGMF